MTPVLADSGLVRVSYVLAEPDLPPPAAVPLKQVAVNLETVFRLTDEKNAQLARARAKVAEAEATAAVAEHSCVPDALRHEDHRRAATETRLWQARAEAAQTRAELLTQAGSTYFDWLAARRGELLTRDLIAREEKLLGRARALARDEKGANVLVESIQTTLRGHRQSALKLGQQAQSAAAKVAYLMGMPDAPLVPLDPDLIPVDLVPSQPLAALIQQAQSNGPGVAELQALEATIEQAIADARCLQAACRLTGRCTLCGRLQAAQAKLDQVRFARMDLAGKLEAGVRDANAEIVEGRAEMTETQEAVRHAQEAYTHADRRLADTVSSQTLGDAMGSIRGLEAAHLGNVQTVNAYDKAQVRLLVLLGLAGCHAAP
jgi:outer membrane protein TolC